MLQSGSGEIDNVRTAFQIFLDGIISSFTLPEDCQRLVSLFEGSALNSSCETWHPHGSLLNTVMARKRLHTCVCLLQTGSFQP